MKYYHFRQNNSGGSFDIDDKVTVNVWIQAETANQANERAEDIGIYFDGVDDEVDCACCGDRWYPASERDSVPSPEDIDDGDMFDGHTWVKPGVPYCRIYNFDGSTINRVRKL